MTTQDYINEEIRRDRDGTLQPTDQHRKQWPFAQIFGGNLDPSELILLRAKVRELTDQLAEIKQAKRDLMTAQIELRRAWAKVGDGQQSEEAFNALITDCTRRERSAFAKLAAACPPPHESTDNTGDAK